MHTVPSRLAWRSVREIPRTTYPQGLTLTALVRNSSLQQLQQNTFSLQKGPYWSFEVNKLGKQTIFQLFSEVDFLAALDEGPSKKLSNFLKGFLQLAGWRVLGSTWL